MQRHEQLLSIRPSIPTIIEENAASSAEIFQNRTLRPVLKYQNDLLLELFRQYIDKRKGGFYQLSEAQQLQYIEHSIRQDTRFRHLLKGVIVGQFTVAEWQLFVKEESELSRRLSGLLVQRLQSQRDKL